MNTLEERVSEVLALSQELAAYLHVATPVTLARGPSGGICGV